MMLEQLLNSCNNILSAPHFLLVVLILSLIVKSYVFINLISRRGETTSSKLNSTLLLGILISAIIQEFDFSVGLIKELFIGDISSVYFVFLRRMSWAALPAEYTCLAFFIESLSQKNFKLNLRHKISLGISGFLILFFLIISIFHINCASSADKYLIENIMQKLASIYPCFPLFLTSVLIAIKRQNKPFIPRIIKKQLKLLLSIVIVPMWICDVIQMAPFVFSIRIAWLNTSYGFASLSTILLSFATYLCARKMIDLRFLNFNSQVQSTMNINFMENFKTMLVQFSHVTNIQELTHITQGFFKEAFDIPSNRVHLHIRSLAWQDQKQQLEDGSTISVAETFLTTHSKTTCKFIKEHQILVYDELAFTDFYESSAESTGALAFLNAVQADIFVPIYEKKSLIAFIIVDRYARLDTFYTNTEYDEMLIYVQYLGNIINLIQNKNIDMLMKQEKDLQEELYSKHQEINQYKESIRSFLRNQKHKDIGIIFYKNRRFTFGNQAAKELINVNPNLQEGHPISKSLRKIAHEVEEYKSAQTIHIKDTQGTKIILSAVPSLEHNNVIISVYYPEVTDVIKKQIDALRDPSEWDYLLYLETTKPGKLINLLIPSSGETLLNFKISLLKTALSKKATLLNMPEDDLEQTVELLHHVSFRETLHTINLSEPIKNFDMAIKLFGINSIFGVTKNSSSPLLEKLDNIGTIFIRNIHFLDIETQKYLAEFIRYGFFRVFRSEHKIPSNVRIICSSTQNLNELVQKNKFSQELFNELKETSLEMPSLMTLPEEELNTLADGFSEQAIANQTYKNLLSLSEKDKYKLAQQRPTSLLGLKNRVQQILIHKSKQNDIYDEAQFDPAYEVSDPELVQAARLGKKALKDQKTMSLLWNKFKNQNKIASFLGVNRSSVNRRCKQYNLDE